MLQKDLVLYCICCNSYIHMFQVYVPHFQLVQTYIANVCFKYFSCFRRMFDGCCRGDETLGRRRGVAEDEGVAEDGATARGGAWRA
jgi:hypothetical protein